MKHTITPESVSNWINTEWYRFASSFGNGSAKMFERSLTGQYRVISHRQQKYLGGDMLAAIEAFNAEP